MSNLKNVVPCCIKVFKQEPDRDGRYVEPTKNQMIDKLLEQHETIKKYEAIEQDVGIPLEVLFKALKDGIKVKTYDDDIEEEVILDFEPEELVFDYVLRAITTGRDYIEHDFEFEDYGKTWALTREELE